MNVFSSNAGDEEGVAHATPLPDAAILVVIAGLDESLGRLKLLQELLMHLSPLLILLHPVLGVKITASS